MASRGRGRGSAGRTDPVVDVLGELFQAISDMRQEMQRGPGSSSTAAPIPSAIPLTQAQLLEKFCKCKPPSFKGDYDPVVAEQWIQRIEKIFYAMSCTEEHKVVFATYMLDGEAEHWWNATKVSLRGDSVEVSWEGFKEAFLKKYFPTNIKIQKEREFMEIQQGEMTVGQYASKFEELSKYAKFLDSMPDESWKCAHFERGLNDDIGRAVCGFERKEFIPLVSLCHTIEDRINRVSEEASSGDKRKAVGGSSSHNTKQKGRTSYGGSRNFTPQGSIGASAPGTARVCFNCGISGHLAKNCKKRPDVVCYRCQQKGHISRFCPQAPGAAASAPRTQTQGRVFSLSGEGARVGNLIQGTCLLNGHHLTVLCDAGATHSLFLMCVGRG